MHFEQLMADGVAQLRHVGLGLEPHLLEENLARQRVAVGVQAAGGQTDHRIARPNGLAVEHLGFLDHADNGSAEVVFARLIEAGHLSGLAADERAVVLRARLGKAFDDVLEDARLQPAGANVIQEEERLGAEDGDVVDAMVDQVLADGVVAVQREGELELGADAIDAGNEDGLPVFANVQREEAAEPAHFAEHLRPMRRPEQAGQSGLDLVAQVDIDARAGVSLLFHWPGK